MNTPKAFGTYEKRGNNIYRTSAYIQWGVSEKSIGACLLLNPGSATLNQELIDRLDNEESARGWIKTEDPTMEQLIKLVEKIYGKNQPISGRLHIYNLFNLQNTNDRNAIELFEELVAVGEYDLNESLVTINELKSHPWIMLGWGVNSEGKRKSLKLIKVKWTQLINESGIVAFGKKHSNRDEYYHPCPRIPTQRPLILEELIDIYKQKVNTQKLNIQRFSIYATKSNLINETEYLNENNKNKNCDGWYKSNENPELIVKGFSQLRINEGYKLRAYQFVEGGNGNGIVWAIPVECELPDPSECKRLEDFLFSPKPEQALSDFMEAIEGDNSPLSYLQACIVFHDLHEFGAMWHGVSWGRDRILPFEEESENHEYEWEMIEDEPDIIHPYFYYDNKGNPVVIFHTINDIGTVTLNRYKHTFHKNNYTLEVEKTPIAKANGGIIF